MKYIVSIIVVYALCTVATFARDTITNYSVREALSLPQARNALGSKIRFYFGGQKHGGIQKNYGIFRTNKKTNAFGKTDKEACQWAFLSAMISLRDRAVREGGNAVVNIKSNYRNHLTSSEKTFKCGAGALIAGVAFVGTVVKLEY